MSALVYQRIKNLENLQSAKVSSMGAAASTAPMLTRGLVHSCTLHIAQFDKSVIEIHCVQYSFIKKIFVNVVLKITDPLPTLHVLAPVEFTHSPLSPPPPLPELCD